MLQTLWENFIRRLHSVNTFTLCDFYVLFCYFVCYLCLLAVCVIDAGHQCKTLRITADEDDPNLDHTLIRMLIYTHKYYVRRA